MDHDDPITQFFPGEDAVDLYAVLSLHSSARLEDIKKSYRRLALVYHPDKHATADETVRANASTKFQQIGFAYAVLSDDVKRKRYDATGKTDEGFDLGAGEDGWEAYFDMMFDRVTRGKLDEMKNEYQGSSEEVEDVKNAYVGAGGSLGDIMTYIPHSTHDDEPRFIVLISDLISKGELPSLPTWQASVKDEKERLVRQTKSKKEAKEAEKLAKELGVWDEFYGSGKAGDRKGKGKARDKGKTVDEEDEDHSTLQALILKRKNNMDGLFDSLAAKYGETDPSAKSKGGKGKKRTKVVDREEDKDEQLKKKTKKGAPPAPEINDEEFEKLQRKLFGDKPGEATGSKTKNGRTRRAK